MTAWRWADVGALVQRLLPGLWAGGLLTVALLATPAPFATLPLHEAGRVVAYVFLREAWLSLGMGVGLIVLERSRTGVAAMSTDMLLVLGAVFCTVAGYFGVQPMMEAARSGMSALWFGALHAISLGLFGVKIVLVLGLAIRSLVTAPGPFSWR